MTGKIFPITPGMIYLIIQDAATKSGMTIKPHDLRRSTAKLMLEGGAPIEQISVILGHANIKTTQIYLGVALELRPGKAATDMIQFNTKDTR